MLHILIIDLIFPGPFELLSPVHPKYGSVLFFHIAYFISSLQMVQKRAIERTKAPQVNKDAQRDINSFPKGKPICNQTQV